MKYLTLCLIFIFSTTNGKSQCGYIQFTTQAEIDDSPKKFDKCNSFDFIDIRNDKESISNLDSLRFLISTNRLTILDTLGALKSIKGVEHFKKATYFVLYLNKNYDPFYQLDTLTQLIFGTNNSQVNLTVFKSLKHIRDAILVIDSIKMTGLSPFTTDKIFSLILLRNDMPNSLDNIIPQNSPEVMRITIFKGKHLSSKGVERLNIISRLELNNVSHCDFRELYNIPQMDTLIIRVQRDTLDYQQGFVNVTSLKRLELDTIEEGGDLVPLLPALEYVEEYISITNSSDIRNLDFLSRLRVSIPTPSKDPEPYLVVRNNPNLTGCVNPFICNLLRSQPNRVILENNGAGCDKATILASCLTATEDKHDDQALSIYPNPFYEVITLLSSDRTQHMVIYNTAGQRMQLDYLDKDTLDTSTWPEGMYILQYLHGDKVQYYKVIKQ